MARSTSARSRSLIHLLPLQPSSPLSPYCGAKRRDLPASAYHISMTYLLLPSRAPKPKAIGLLQRRWHSTILAMIAQGSRNVYEGVTDDRGRDHQGRDRSP